MELGKYKQALSYLKSPRLPLANGTDVEAPPPKPYTFENFKKVADLYVQTYFGTQSVDLPGFPSKKEIVVDRLNQEYEKAMEAGVDSKDALGYIQDRKKFYLDLIEKGEDFPPSYGSEEIVERTDLKKGGDTDGFRKFLETYNPTETYKGYKKDLAKQFGISTDTAGDIIRALRPDLDKLPKRKTKAVLAKEATAKKLTDINFLNAEEFKKQYNLFKPGVKEFETGSVKEFAKFLNNKGFKTMKGGEFTEDNLNLRLIRADLPSKFDLKKAQAKQLKEGLPLKPDASGKKAFTDEFLRSEAERMNLDVEGKSIDEIRKMVFTSRNIEKGKTEEEIRELRNFRTRQRLKKTQKPRQFPYDIGRLDKMGLDEAAKKLFWRDLIGVAQAHQNYLVNRAGPKLENAHIEFADSAQTRGTDVKSTFDIKLIDTNVMDSKGLPKVITFENFLKHIDENKNLYRIDSETALGEYKKKRFIQSDAELRDLYNKKLNKNYDPTNKFNRTVFSPFHIHHTAGRGQNAFNVQFAVGTENMQENAFRKKFNKDFKLATTLSEKKKVTKNYLDNVSPFLEVRIRNTPYGERESLVAMTERIAPELVEKLKASPKAEGVKLSANPFADPELLSRYLSQIPKDVANLGLRGLAALDVPVIQALFATMTDFAEDSPLITTLPLAFTDEASRLMGLYNESGGNFKKFSRLVARAGVPIEGAKKLFPIVSKVGKIGSTYALPALQLGQEVYQYNQELDRVRKEAENFNLPIDKAMKAYNNFLDINTPPILDYDEESTLSDRGRANLDAIKRDFQEIGALFGIGESPYKDDTPDQPSAFSPPLTERRKPDFKKDSGITSYRPSSDDRNFLAEGGIVQRIGFKEGTPKKGITRRSFLKLASLVPATMAGIASIRLGPAKTKKIFTTIENIKDSTTKIPDWFATFANKFRNTGDAENLFQTKKIKLTEDEYNKAIEAGDKRVFQDTARTLDYKINNPNHMDYYRLEDTDEVIATTYTNKKIPGVQIEDYGNEVVVNWDNSYSQPVEMRYQKGQDFVATDARAYSTDPDGGFDVQDEIVRTVDDMYEGTSRTMEEFATGKKVNKVSSGERQVMDAEIRAEQLAENAAEDATFTGDPIDLITRDD